MFAAKRLVVTAAFALLPALAHAQQPATLDDLDADRLNPTQVKIEFDYQGGACEKVGDAQLGAVVDGALAVTFPTSKTGDMCTMQVVEIEVEQAIAADASVTRVDVTLLAPDGSVFATGTDNVDQD